jgi:Arc/MetJ-type ribon-helix-helix transcriptional regulator
MKTLNTTITEKQHQQVTDLLEQGEYGTTSEIVREALRDFFAKKDRVIFNADRDNNGKGVPAKEMIAFLEKQLS